MSKDIKHIVDRDPILVHGIIVVNVILFYYASYLGSNSNHAASSLLLLIVMILSAAAVIGETYVIFSKGIAQKVAAFLLILLHLVVGLYSGFIFVLAGLWF